MSHASRRANREELKAQRKERNRAQKALRCRLEQEDTPRKPHATTLNGKSRYRSTEEEGEARTEAAWEQLKVLRAKLPFLLKRFAAIPDPRNPKKTKHKLTVLLLYGILSFVLQMASSREATREMSRPMFWENLRRFFPELEAVPHHDTLKRLLVELDIGELESIHLELVQRWIRQKKFLRFLVDNCYPIAVDGTQKICRDELWAEECLQRTFNKGETPVAVYDRPEGRRPADGTGGIRGAGADRAATAARYDLGRPQPTVSLGQRHRVRVRTLSGELTKIVKDTGMRGLIRFVRESIAGPWLDAEWLREKLAAPFQLRLT